MIHISGSDYNLFFFQKYMRDTGSKSFALAALFLFLLLFLREVCCKDDASHAGADTGGGLNSEVVLVTRSAVIPIPSQPSSHGACRSQEL